MLSWLIHKWPFPICRYAAAHFFTEVKPSVAALRPHCTWRSVTTEERGKKWALTKHDHLYLTGAETCVPSHCHFSMEYLIPTNIYILTSYVLATILVELPFTKDNEKIME